MNKGIVGMIFILLIGTVIAIMVGVGVAYIQNKKTDVMKLSDNPISSAVNVIDRIDPEGQFKQTRDTQRRADILAISVAVYQHAADNDGILPGDNNFPKAPTCIGSSPECFDLANEGIQSIVPTYIQEMPMDPKNGTIENTQYTLYMNQEGRLVVQATGETEKEIIVMR